MDRTPLDWDAWEGKAGKFSQRGGLLRVDRAGWAPLLHKSFQQDRPLCGDAPTARWGRGTAACGARQTCLLGARSARCGPPPWAAPCCRPCTRRHLGSTDAGGDRRGQLSDMRAVRPAGRRQQALGWQAGTPVCEREAKHSVGYAPVTTTSFMVTGTLSVVLPLPPAAPRGVAAARAQASAQRHCLRRTPRRSPMGASSHAPTARCRAARRRVRGVRVDWRGRRGRLCPAHVALSGHASLRWACSS